MRYGPEDRPKTGEFVGSRKSRDDTKLSPGWLETHGGPSRTVSTRLLLVTCSVIARCYGPEDRPQTGGFAGSRKSRDDTKLSLEMARNSA